MKNKKYLFWGTFIMEMAFATVLACATTFFRFFLFLGGGGMNIGTPPVPDKPARDAAKQLAAEINAIKAGSAAVEGGTVRLTDEVNLSTGLTVPAGVTLELTAEGAWLALQNGAELTVDGHGERLRPRRPGQELG
jgi:hypothetical protein